MKAKLQDLIVDIAGINDHRECLKKLQRSRTRVLWHDHSTIAGSGYLLMTIHSLYDPAIYLSTAEYERNTGRKCTRTVQEIVEEPELYTCYPCQVQLCLTNWQQWRIDWTAILT